jgi:hypothetical protein
VVEEGERLYRQGLRICSFGHERVAMKHRAIAPWGLSIILVLIVVTVGLTASTASRSFAAPAKTSASTTHQLAVISARDYESDYKGYRYIEGEVKNISGAPLKNVAVVGVWLDKDGHFITSEAAFLKFDPFLPGQTSRFKMISAANPAMHKFRLEFRSLLGGALRADDLRERQ